MDKEDLQKFIGVELMFFLVDFVYTGTVSSVLSNSVVLTNAVIVYDTGSFADAGWARSEPLPVASFMIKYSEIKQYGVLQQPS